jgi:two-component system OmpR family response regulator
LIAMQILVVEDDASTARRIASALIDEGYEVIAAADAGAARDAIAAQEIQAIIFDRLLGDDDALGEIAAWRRSGVKTPILILSSLSGMGDRVEGLEAGADDYLVKPFHDEELAARLKALLRARNRHAQLEPDVVVCGSIRIDRRHRTAERGGVALQLQPREFRLLETLASADCKPVPRSVLLEKVWNLNFDPRTKIIETHVSRLRDKLDRAGPGEAIETVRGVGYRLRSDV